MCGVDLLKGQEASATSKERLPKNRSGNKKCRWRTCSIICQFFLMCIFLCGGFFVKLRGQMCVACLFQAPHQVAHLVDVIVVILVCAAVEKSQSNSLLLTFSKVKDNAKEREMKQSRVED